MPVTTEAISTSNHLSRSYHTEETSSYWLAKDDEEQARLAGQQIIYKEMFNGNTLKSVKKNIDFESGARVLDVGCSAGAWVADMAQEYPKCVFDGCDIVDAIDKKTNLVNFTFSRSNVAQGLPYPDNTFDFVQMRLLIFALRADEWPKAIKEIIRVVKPGGMFQLIEAGFELPKDVSAFQRFVTANYAIAASRGQDPKAQYKLESWISENKNVQIKQVEKKMIDLSLDNSVSNRFRWNVTEFLKSSFTNIEPFLKLDEDISATLFIENFERSLRSLECFVGIVAVAAQKQ
ncbi:S-adenosyl-L-methionine-dependent methyltransferase [Sporodiniella umbellata]|nr:S-adenosyl-L-methionine-dependent methyltransferase [Sporodiniella umbellata]